MLSPGHSLLPAWHWTSVVSVSQFFILSDQGNIQVGCDNKPTWGNVTKVTDHGASPPPNFTNWLKITPGASSKCIFTRPYLQRLCFSKSKVRLWNCIINQHPVWSDAGEVRVFSLMLLITQKAGLSRAPMCQGLYISYFILTIIPWRAGCYYLILQSEK